MNQYAIQKENKAQPYALKAHRQYALQLTLQGKSGLTLDANVNKPISRSKHARQLRS